MMVIVDVKGEVGDSSDPATVFGSSGAENGCRIPKLVVVSCFGPALLSCFFLAFLGLLSGDF